MTVEEIKKSLTGLSADELREISAFLFHLRHVNDPEYQDIVAERIEDSNRANWLTPEEFEKRLDRAKCNDGSSLSS